MIAIIRSWMDSLKLFTPNNITQFVQAIGNAWLRMVWVLLKNFWWLLIGCFIVLYIRPHWILFIAMLILWLLLVIIAVRPSLHRKDFHYFSEHLIYGFPLLILFAMPCCIPAEVSIVFAPYLFLTMFFVCDSDFKFLEMIMAPVRAAIMVVKKLPIYVGLIGLFALCNLFPTMINLFITTPLLITVISVCYTMWLHKNYQEYYEGCC